MGFNIFYRVMVEAFDNFKIEHKNGKYSNEALERLSPIWEEVIEALEKDKRHISSNTD